ncbi:MAG: prephenate dehydratase domain-containing protein, partial [Candidatus Limnocylindrales bacterium]
MSSPPKVAFQGEPGAFSEDAVLAFFAAAEPVAVPTWRAIFEAVRDGSVDAGVCAIENSLAGSIRETYDLLAEFDLHVVGEVSVPVRLALLALAGQSVDTIERVYSKSEALAQADEFLRTRSWQVLTTYNTAGAARSIAERHEMGAAAVASPRVATLYGLEILADGIQTGSENRTRFAVLARGSSIPEPWRAPLSPGADWRAVPVGGGAP